MQTARCKIGARAFGCWSREVNADRKSGWAGETGAPTSLSGALELLRAAGRGDRCQFPRACQTGACVINRRRTQTR